MLGLVGLLVLQLAVTTLLPVAPLLLTMFSVEELLDCMAGPHGAGAMWAG